MLIERMLSELDIDIVLTAYRLTEASGFGTMCRDDDDAVAVATTCGRPIAAAAIDPDVAAEAVQLHGGIAITAEHDIQLYFKRAHGSSQLFGQPAEYLRRLETEALTAD